MSETIPATLPAWLARQTSERPTGIAFRHKRLGIWQARTWAQVQAEVLALAAALEARGFSLGDRLAIISRPRPEALLAALAAQWLGGVAVLFDPLGEAAHLGVALREANAAFVFAEGAEEIALLDRAGPAPALLFYADGRGLAGQPGHGAVDYAELLRSARASRLPPRATALGVAFAFYREVGEGLEAQRVGHAELLDQGLRLVQAEGLDAREEALAARAFAASGQARYLLAPWLIAGFRLNFPEALETRDNDRRELGPTLVLGTRDTYGRLYRLVQERLPPPGTLRRRLVDWSLTVEVGPLRRLLGYWLVRRPLRDTLGLGRTRAPLLVGAPLQAEVRAFFAGLGVEVRNWQAAEQWVSTRIHARGNWPASQPSTT